MFLNPMFLIGNRAICENKISIGILIAFLQVCLSNCPACSSEFPTILSCYANVSVFKDNENSFLRNES
jgi:hypothetical protein